jgi:UDP-N-acetylmuramoylalanine--D-glutamate ligase
VEFSSYQIDLTPSLRPDVAILLNITPDHLDRHGDLDHYADVKARIFAIQREGDAAIVALDDEPCRRIAAGIETPARKIEIASQRELANGFYACGGQLFKADTGAASLFADLAGIVSLRGGHNGQNAAAAAAAALALGLDRDEIVAGFASFPGLSHRMEQVGERHGVLFINDSKATNADAAARALSSFDDILWIAGGLAKDGGIQNLKEFFPKIDKAYLIGEAAEEFADVLNGKVDHEIVGTLERAVDAVARDLTERTAPAVVLFSPACASFDQFRNFELRGDAFRDAVHALSGMAKSKGN